MKRSAVLTGLILAGVLPLLAGVRAHASGFQLQEQSASGLGVAFSGMPAAAQDASTVFWNPAAMPLLQGTQLSAAVHYIDTSFDFVSAGGPPAGSTYNALGDGGDAGSGTPVPALYGKISINPRLAAGLAINAPFGLKTEWDAPWAGMFAAIKSEVKTVNINPSLGYDINDRFYLGAGVSYERLEATLTNGVTPVPAALLGAQGKVKGHDWAFGWNVGALARLGEGTRLGVTYRSAIDYTIEGDLSFNNPAFAAAAGSVKAKLKVPSTLAVGLSQQIGSSLRALADVTWTRWDSVQALTIVRSGTGATVANAPLNFKNSWRAGAGLEYQLTPAWLLRGGAAYDRSPVQDTFRSPRLPDDDRRWLAAGVRFQPNPQWSLDLGYAHLWVQEAPSMLAPQSLTVPGALVGHYTSSSNVFGAQASVSF